MSTHPADCPLCAETGGLLIVQQPLWRVVRVLDEAFPAFYRVIWQAPVAEFTDLDPVQRVLCMEVVCRMEQVLRDALNPTKINLASLGNVVPHLHWHVLARFDWDSHFPNPIWGEAVRNVVPAPSARLAIDLQQIDQQLRGALGSLST